MIEVSGTTWSKNVMQLRLCYRVFTRSSKRPANFQQMYSKYTRIARRLLEVCWMFAGSCKHPISRPYCQGGREVSDNGQHMQSAAHQRQHCLQHIVYTVPLEAPAVAVAVLDITALGHCTVKPELPTHLKPGAPVVTSSSS